MIRIFILILLFTLNTIARETGQTEITTEEGIEVFQKEKFYLLKKNVNILSDNFELSADLVKAYFEKDLYDVTKIESEGSVNLTSAKGLIAKGQKINFSTKNEDIYIYGEKSSLLYKNINMFSDESIMVNNLTGEFNLRGNNSELKTETIQIFADVIDGKYVTINDINEVEKLYVEDENIANIITDTSNMFAKRAKYNKKENIIELFDNVKLIRGGETITGDYAKLNTLDESYKITSNNQEKVKVIITDTDE